MKCKHCEQEFENTSQLANHVRWKHRRAEFMVKCRYCKIDLPTANVGQHEKSCIKNPDVETSICKQCGEVIKGKIFCNHSCSAKYNNEYGLTGWKRMIINGTHPNAGTAEETYRTICFNYWDKCCAICGWDITVCVHHIDHNHDNNNPKNLIPLCPNHHEITRLKNGREYLRENLEKKIDLLLVDKWK